MTAVTDCAGDDHAAVGLSFGHALTAVTVKTGDGMLGGEVTKVELTGVYGSGTHVIGSNAWTVSGAVRSFAVERKVELPDQSDDTVDNAYTEAGKPIVDGDVTLMMIPQTLPEGAALKIHFRDKLSGGNRTLTASLGGKVWPVGRKVAYAVSSTGVVISPKVEIVPSRTDVHPSGSLFGLQLAAYASVAQAGQKDAPVVALPYTVEYATSVDGTNWSEWSAGEWVPDKAPAAGRRSQDEGVGASETEAADLLRTAARIVREEESDYGGRASARLRIPTTSRKAARRPTATWSTTTDIIACRRFTAMPAAPREMPPISIKRRACPRRPSSSC